MNNVLVIDDDIMMRSMLEDMLEREGYNVKTAENGRVGINVYQENPTDLVITDIIMPEQEGLSTIIELKNKYPDAKIIAMSGGGRIGPKTYLQAAKEMGATYTVTKPFKHKFLVSKVKEILQTGIN